MTSEEIRLELYKRRKTSSQSSIARSLGITRQAVASTIDRVIVSQRIMAAIAKAIGQPVEYVFPEYFLQRKAG